MSTTMTATAAVLQRDPCACVQPAPTTAGTVIGWSHNLSSDIAIAHFVFTNVADNVQTHVDAPKDSATGVGLPAGLYRVVAYANGAAPQRGIVNLTAGNTTPIEMAFTAAQKVPTLSDAAARFGVQVGNVRDLEVPAGQTLVLDSNDTSYKGWAQMVKITSVAQAKAMLGNPDELFPNLPGSAIPRFAQPSLSAAAGPSALVRQAGREYIFGNSGSVVQWRDQIDRLLFDEAMLISLFMLGTVTINKGATLVVGQGSHAFLCQKLLMHITGTLKIVGTGPVHVEPLVIQTFMDIPFSRFGASESAISRIG